MKLLEREQFISVLSELFQNAKNDHGSMVSISGEAGIGKSSLVECFIEKYENDAKVLWGTCDDLFTPRPLAPLFDIAQQLNSKIITQLDSGISRPSIFSNFLKEIQNCEPNIIIIEDVHWADESTLDLLKFLGRRINKLKTLLIITYRDDELKSDHPLKLALSSLPANYLKRIKLSPLSKESVNLLASNYGREISSLFENTGGNPLLVTEVLSNEIPGVSATINELVTSKLNRISNETRTAVELISVIPGKAEKWIVQQLVDDFSVIDTIIDVGILRSEPETILFRHELTRMAIEESISESKRIDLNSRVLNVLITQKNIDHFLSRIIHHASRASDVNTIIKYSIPAANQASKLGAHRQAVKIYNIAIQYTNQLSLEQQLTLLEGISYECFLTGQVSEAIIASEKVIAILKDHPDPEREGEIYRRLSRMLWYNCQDNEAEIALDTAISIFEKLIPSNQLAMSYSNKSQMYSIREDYQNTLIWGNKALTLARKLNNIEIEAHSLNNIGCVKFSAGEETGEIDLLKSLEISKENDLYEHATRAYVNLGSIHLQQRNLYSADKYFSNGLEYGNEKDIYVFSLCMAGHHAKAKLHLGLWDESIDLANYVLKQKDVPPGNKVMPLNVLAVIRSRRNDPGSLKLINECMNMALEMGEIEKIVSITAAKAEYFWLQNRLIDIEKELESIYSKVLKTKNQWAIGEVAYWYWKSGGLFDIPPELPEPYLFHIIGKWQEASDSWEELHCPYEKAMALSEGDEESMKKSLEIFESLGASSAVQLIKQKMRDSGIRSIPKGPRKSTKENFAGLTSRQLEVLKLVANGMSNSEIAENLFISAKTVDHHVSAIFSKLNIHSRVEAAGVINSNVAFQK